ncbi:MAG: response regulator transcription factor [Lachnospiraceae bacterium]|nr:response regulator transcription factor [Lachnospiraceae bacterium]
MITIVICDDESTHRRAASHLVNDVMHQKGLPYEEKTYENAEDLLHDLSANVVKPDIAVLDIKMEGKDGITLAKELNTICPSCHILFFTSYLEYAPDAYEAEHIWFVVKDRAKEHFAPAMEKALKHLKEDSEKSYEPTILVRSQGRSIPIPAKDILYLSRIGRKAHIFLKDVEYEDSRRAVQLLDGLLDHLFIQCHQGYWVNVEKIEELDHEEFVLEGGIRIPISRTFREAARKKFFERYR